MLIVALDTSKKEPLYEQIYNSIKEEIITGVLPFGARLPSARRLSKHLDVSRNTVDTAYAQLCAEGYIESKPKRGFFVCQVEELAELHIPVKIEEEEEEIRPEKIPYDFSSAGVDMEQFPYHIWRKLLKEIMINDNSELFQKGNFQGDLELRKAIMYYLRQSRGVHVHASQIVVAAGMENLLFLLRQILGEKVSIGIENPVYKNAYEILKELDFKIHPISMDESGMCVEQLQKTDANLAYVTPAHQYPTGVIMPIGRRSQLLGWAKKDPDHYIIEDDYDSEFRYHGEILSSDQVPWGRKEGGFMWAPDCAYRNGTYYFYFPHPSETDWNDSWKIGVATSDKPAEGFKVQGYIEGMDPMIDPCVFVDDDGQAYIYNGGGGTCKGGKLKDNMIELDGPMRTMEGLSDFHEATWIHKYNGKYYLSYSDNHDDGEKHNRMCYAISDSPLGPWEYKGIYMDPTDSYTNHGSIVEFKGQWYSFYHNSALSGHDWLRSICVDKLYYNPDGTIKMVKQTK